MRKIRSVIEKFGYWESIFTLGICFNVVPCFFGTIINLFDNSNDIVNKVNYSNVPCLPPNELCGTWAISTPCNPTTEKMKGWEDLRLILYEDGTFYFKPIPYYVMDRPSGFSSLKGKWGLVSYVYFDSKREIPYYWVSLYLFPHAKMEPIIIGSVIDTGSQAEMDQYRIKRILGMAEYSSETYGFYLRRISVETNRR